MLDQGDDRGVVFSGETTPDVGTLFVEFYGSEPRTGIIDLTNGGNDNYATCQECVRIGGGQGKLYFPTEGTLVITFFFQ